MSSSDVEGKTSQSRHYRSSSIGGSSGRPKYSSASLSDTEQSGGSNLSSRTNSNADIGGKRSQSDVEDNTYKNSRKSLFLGPDLVKVILL